MTSPDDLNPPQRAAVEHFEGPLLVLAGPGSGKTRVITRRIARLVARGVDPREILAITFTNKAAGEMADRARRLLPDARVWVSTFHRLCARLLRQYARVVGLHPNYSIYDTSDQRQLLRHAYAALHVDSTHYSPASVAHRISEAKSQLLSAEQFSQLVQEKAGDYFNRIVADLYREYEQLLLAANAVDFDDLLMHVCLLLEHHADIRADLDRRFRFVLVDEYQDTNAAQYRIVRALAQDYPNVCVTGDPDQSIYRWRGADIGNILRFERDYPAAVVVRLEQNYRSTQTILAAADRLISQNQRRKAKSLFTHNAAGTPPELLCFAGATEEANEVAGLIGELARRENRPWSDFAVVYRVNALSRSLEHAFRRQGIPHQVAGGVAFYERKEVKDLLAYLRLIQNPADSAAFERVVNVPARSIGAKSVKRLLEYAARERLTPLAAAGAASPAMGVSKRAGVALKMFAAMLHDLAATPFLGVKDLLSRVLDRTRYRNALQDGDSEEDRQRAANVDELLTAAAQYDEQHPQDSSLEGFLETASLTSEVDNVDESAGKATLLTLHAAKGLEFPVVIVLAVEQNILPHERSLRDNNRDELEEERRLLFVGMTRARERLYLTQTYERELRGVRLRTINSQFIAELGLTVQWRERRDGDWANVTQRELAAGVGARGGEDPAIALHRQRLRDAGADGTRPLITTGAALLNGSKDSAAIPGTWTIGTQVRHPRYGLGTITQSTGGGRYQSVTVQFASGESHDFVAHKAPLQPIGVQPAVERT